MSEELKTQMRPGYELVPAVFRTLGDWEDHVFDFMNRPNYRLDDFDDRDQVKKLIASPLLAHWEEISSSKKNNLKIELQYVLNEGEHTSYASNKRNKSLRCKEGCYAQNISSSCQNTMVAYDGYALFEWMWQILFPAEDWHTDISQWIVNKDSHD